MPCWIEFSMPSDTTESVAERNSTVDQEIYFGETNKVYKSRVEKEASIKGEKHPRIEVENCCQQFGGHGLL